MKKEIQPINNKQKITSQRAILQSQTKQKKKTALNTLSVAKNSIDKSISDKIQYRKHSHKVLKNAQSKKLKSTKNVLLKLKTVQNIDNFYTFVHTLPLTLFKKHNYKNIQKKSSFLKTRPIKKFPRQIVDILYRQNMPNYNPYIQTLQKCIKQSPDMTNSKYQFGLKHYQIQEIKKLCYIGIAKTYLKNKKFGNAPKYSKVNILIRTYMFEKMKEIIQQKSQNYENIIYIPTQPQGLSFSLKNYPNDLSTIMRKQIFSQTLKQVNKIIQKEYVQYKKINMEKVQEDNLQNFIYFLLALFTVIFLMSKNWVLLILIAIVILLFVLVNLLKASKNLDNLVSTKNVSQRIKEKIQKYFKSINSQTIEWKVGQDFYWLEIHFIKKKRGKTKVKKMYHNLI